MNAPHGATRGAIRRFFDWAVCGYSEASGWYCYTRDWRIGMDSRRGRFVHWMLDLHWSIAHAPRTFRWWLSDQLMRHAMRLRGQEVTTLGYYDDLRGNEQAKLIEHVEFKCIANLDTDTFKEMHELLEELASLCGAISYKDK